MNIPFFKCQMSDREFNLVSEVLQSGWLTTAGKAAEFEGKFKEICNVSHALAVNSCTAALHLGLEALGIGPGDKVVVPSLTFTATAEVVRYLGADPIFVDIDRDTALINKEHLKKAVEHHGEIKACIVVHFAGQPAELDGPNGLWTYCQEQGIRLIQDAAHALPAHDSYGSIGSIGDITCFSFYANKTITTGEGGMLVTNETEIADRVKVMRLHGINRDVWNRFTSTAAPWEYDVVAPGYKYNMPDINAAIGLAQLERSEHFRDERQRCAEHYIAQLSELPYLRTLKLRVEPDQHSWHLLPVIIDAQSPINRNEVIEKLNQHNIGTSVHYKPLHLMSYYRDTYNLAQSDFPNTEMYWRGCLSLPIYPSLSNHEIDYVVEVLKRAMS